MGVARSPPALRSANVPAHKHGDPVFDHDSILGVESGHEWVETVREGDDVLASTVGPLSALGSARATHPAACAGPANYATTQRRNDAFRTQSRHSGMPGDARQRHEDGAQQILRNFGAGPITHTAREALTTVAVPAGPAAEAMAAPRHSPRAEIGRPPCGEVGSQVTVQGPRFRERRHTASNRPARGRETTLNGSSRSLRFRCCWSQVLCRIRPGRIRSPTHPPTARGSGRIIGQPAEAGRFQTFVFICRATAFVARVQNQGDERSWS